MPTLPPPPATSPTAGTRTTSASLVRFDHLGRLTHPLGVWEHARFTVPRPEHGFCTDDAARAVVVATRAPADPAARRIADASIRFVLDARAGPGRYRNRRDRHGRWLDDRGPDDTQGRVWWALGVLAADPDRPADAARATDRFAEVEGFRSPWLRPLAGVCLGAAALLAAQPTHAVAAVVLDRCSATIAAAVLAARGWPEPMLTYDNARLPDALVAAGAALGDDVRLRLGLDLLAWLVREQTIGTRCSLVPAGGRRPGDPKPAFDQQPLEAAAMASACARAGQVTAAPAWSAALTATVGWLLGANDAGLPLYDPRTGATFDGLHERSVNRNRGAESTVSGLEILQAGAAGAVDVVVPDGLAEGPT